MKRDMDLIREILRTLESAPHPAWSGYLRIQGYEHEQVQYHTYLLCEAGLIDGVDASDRGGLAIINARLTWQGYEFLEASRDDKLWSKAKKTLLEKGGGLVFEVLKELLNAMLRQAIAGQP